MGINSTVDFLLTNVNISSYEVVKWANHVHLHVHLFVKLWFTAQSET